MVYFPLLRSLLLPLPLLLLLHLLRLHRLFRVVGLFLLPLRDLACLSLQPVLAPWQ